MRKPKEKVVSIAHRFERWEPAFETENISASVSSHCRMRIKIGNEITTLPLVEATSFLGRISEAIEKVMSADTSFND